MRLPLIQVLRALAALMVAAGHAQHDAAGLAARTGAAFPAGGWLPWNAGVDVFFVVSGFVIVHAAGPLYGRPGARRIFLAHRVARVVPLYWLLTTAYLALALARPDLLNRGGPDLDPGTVAASYLFWPVLKPDGFVQPLYSLGWTLNYEMAFYGLFALALPWPRRRAVAGVLTGLVALTIVNASGLPLPTPLAFWTDPIVLEFALGAALGLLRAEGVTLGPALRLGLAAAGLALLALAGAPGPRALAWGGPAALLVAAAALGPARPARPGRTLRAAILLGDASYALYLLHPFVIRLVRVTVEQAGLAPRLGPCAVIALMLVLSCGAALLLHGWIERPLNRRLRAALEARLRPAAPDPSPARA